jgi:hypothetical protein
MTTNSASAVERVQGLVLVAIVLLVGLMAGAASFSHVHEWTLANSPTGTPDWFGWANAVISELIPTAALIEIGRRRRAGKPTGYPMVLLLAAVAVSLTAQLAVAEPTVFGWIVSALPALAFFALSKLVFTATKPTAATGAQLVDEHPTNTTDAPSDVEPGEQPVPSTTEAPSSSEVPAHLLGVARFAVVNHEQTTGRPITPGELAARMNITPDVAGRLIAAITGRSALAPINGASPVLVGGAR